jgi:hypothetical protein
MTKEELNKIEREAEKLGYTKYNQRLLNSSYQYFKKFPKYQIGLLIYDFSKFGVDNTFSIMYQCMLDKDHRIDLTVSKNIEVKEFEEMAKTFNRAMKGY